MRAHALLAAVKLSMRGPHVRRCACSFNAALDTARKGDDLWIKLAECGVQLAKAKKVRACLPAAWSRRALHARLA